MSSTSRTEAGTKESEEEPSYVPTEEGNETVAAFMTEMALKDDAMSASTSTIQDDIMQTLHQIEVKFLRINL